MAIARRAARTTRPAIKPVLLLVVAWKGAVAVLDAIPVPVLEDAVTMVVECSVLLTLSGLLGLVVMPSAIEVAAAITVFDVDPSIKSGIIVVTRVGV